jgi:hypothetical protein
MSMSPERTQEALETLKVLRRDIERDVYRFEGAPFNGQTAAVYLGNISAAVSVVARVLIEHIADGDS